MASAMHALDRDLPVPYTVRNTFIELKPSCDEDDADGIFSTWHHPAREAADPLAEPPPEHPADAAGAGALEPAPPDAPESGAVPSRPPRGPPPQRPAVEVRNTFIELKPSRDEDDAEGVFSTWHHPARRIDEEETSPEPSLDISFPTSLRRVVELDTPLSPSVASSAWTPRQRSVEDKHLGPAVEVRNTFIDIKPASEEDDADGVFSTWHHPARKVEEEAVESADPHLGAGRRVVELDPARGPAPIPTKEPPVSPAVPSQPPRQPPPQQPREAFHRRFETEVHAPPVGLALRPALRPPPGFARAGRPPSPSPPRLEEGEIGEEDDDEELEDGELLEQEEQIKEAPVPSLGSASHGTGSCRPCAWLHKSAEGCRNGVNCEYCHLCPPGEIKRRKQEKLQRRFLNLKQAREAVQANGGLQAGDSSLSPSTPQGDSSRGPGGIGVSALEPCYIELPGIARARPVRASLGSVDHGTGLCRPCAWVHKDANGCKNGASCAYCHLCPLGELKRRKQAKWEAQVQQQAAQAAAAAAAAAGVAET